MKALTFGIHNLVIVSVVIVAACGHIDAQTSEWGLLLPTPSGIATAGNIVYVASLGQPQIVIISNQVQLGAITNPIGQGLNLGQPWGMTTDSNGVLYVADRQFKCVFALSNQVCIKVFGPLLTQDLGAMGDVRDVAIDKTGRVDIIDNARNTVWVYNQDTSYSGYLNAPGTLSSPVSIAIDSSNIAYVSESFTQYLVNPATGNIPGNDIKMFYAGTNNAGPINSWGVEPIFDFQDGCCYGGHGWGFEGGAGVRCASSGAVVTISTLGAEQYCCFNDPSPVQLSWSIWNPPGQAIGNYTITVPNDSAAQFYVPCMSVAPDGTEIIAIPTEGSITAYSPAGTAPVAPFITTQPQSEIVSAHHIATFNVAALGSAPLNYQWLFDGTNIPGATAPTLTVSNITQTNLGPYSVIVSNASGSTTSTTALLEMYPFLAMPFTGAITYLGEPATFTVVAWGTEPLGFQWFANGAAIENATNATLSFLAMQYTNAGYYSVEITNALGSISSGGQLVVNPAGVVLGLYPALTISGGVGNAYTISYTTNLSLSNSWINLTNLALEQPVQLWVDTNADASLPANPQRFYLVQPTQQGR